MSTSTPEIKLLTKWWFFGAIVREPGLTPTALRVAYLIVDHFNTDVGYAWPSEPYLAKQLGITVRSVASAVRLLDAEGWIKKEVPRGQGRANRYVPNWDKAGKHQETGKNVQAQNLKEFSQKDENLPPENLNVSSSYTSYKTNYENLDFDTDYLSRGKTRTGIGNDNDGQASDFVHQQAFQKLFVDRLQKRSVCKKNAWATFNKLIEDGVSPDAIVNGSYRWVFDDLPECTSLPCFGACVGN